MTSPDGKYATEPHTTGTFNTIEEVKTVLMPVMNAVAAAIGPSCELVLHDLTTRDLRHSIVAIVNGHVTGRSVGGPSTNIGLTALQNPDSDLNEFGYAGRTSAGHELRSSTLYYRNNEGTVIAALCINYDLDPIRQAITTLQQVLGTPDEHQDPTKEFIASDIDAVLDDMIDSTIRASGKPAGIMERTDRIEVLRHLEALGVFQVKRAVERVAYRMGVSKPTIYSCLEEIRSPAPTL